MSKANALLQMGILFVNFAKNLQDWVSLAFLDDSFPPVIFRAGAARLGKFIRH